MIPTPYDSKMLSWSVVVIPPVEEPLTVAEAKIRAGLDWPETDPNDPHNLLMADLITASRAQVELDTGLALLTQTRDVYYTVTADGEVLLPSQMLPLQAVLTPEAGVTVRTWTNPGGRPQASLYVEEGSVGGAMRVVVGWADKATLRAEAPLLYHAVALLTAHRATIGRDLAISGAVASINRVPEGYQEAINPYRLLWVV